MAIGDLVATLSVAGSSNPTFVLTSNPGGFFQVLGARLVQAINTPDGAYPITLEATAPGVQITQPFVLTLNTSPTGGPSLDFSQAQNSQYIL